MRSEATEYALTAQVNRAAERKWKNPIEIFRGKRRREIETPGAWVDQFITPEKLEKIRAQSPVPEDGGADVEQHSNAFLIGDALAVAWFKTTHRDPELADRLGTVFYLFDMLSLSNQTAAERAEHARQQQLHPNEAAQSPMVTPDAVAAVQHIWETFKLQPPAMVPELLGSNGPFVMTENDANK